MKKGLCGLRVKVKDALGALVSWLGDKRGKEMNITEWAPRITYSLTLFPLRGD